MSIHSGPASLRLAHTHPSHVLPDNSPSSASNDSPLSETSRRAHRKDVLDKIMEHARQRHNLPTSDSLPNSRTTGHSEGSSSRLSGIENAAAQRNSVLFRHGIGTLPPFRDSARSIMASRPLNNIEHNADSRESRIGFQRQTGNPPTPHWDVNGQYSIDNTVPANDTEAFVRQKLWDAIGNMQKNIYKLTVANGMQEVLTHAVTSYYAGVGELVLNDLFEVQEKARRMEMRIINAQAQLWRAIILDELGRFDLIPELLADALFLAATSAKSLSASDIPPEDADFYQLWRMVWIRKHWFALWKYLKKEEAKESPDLLLQDLESQESKIEAQEWVAQFLPLLEQCFDRTQWPVFDRRGTFVPPLRRNTTQFKQSPNHRTTNHAEPNFAPQQVQDLLKRLRELEVKDTKNAATIERLQSDNLRYKAERQIFDSALSTSRTHSASPPMLPAKNWSDLFSDPAVTHDSFRLITDQVDDQPVRAFGGSRLSAGLGPDRIELLARQLRDGSRRQSTYRKGNRQSQQNPAATAAISPRLLASRGWQPTDRSRPVSEINRSEQNSRISEWMQQAQNPPQKPGSCTHDSRFFSPNSIPLSNPSSGRSSRNRRLLPDQIHPQGLPHTNIPPLRTTGMRNIVQSDNSDPNSHSPSTEQMQMLDDTQDSVASGTLEEELGDDVRPTPHLLTPGYGDMEIVDSPQLLQGSNTGDHCQTTITFPNFDLHESSRSTNDKTRSLKSNQCKGVATSPKSASPLTSPEDVAFTDTPGGDQLEEALSHIRAHQEQRRRSMPNISLGMEESEDLQVGDLPSMRDESSPEQKEFLHTGNIGVNSGSERISGRIDGPVEMLDTPPRHGTEQGFAVMKTGSSSAVCATSEQTQGFSWSISDKDTQRQVVRRSGTGKDSVLKLQMPVPTSSAIHSRRSSVVPASPSPLRASFSQTAFDEPSVDEG